MSPHIKTEDADVLAATCSNVHSNGADRRFQSNTSNQEVDASNRPAAEIPKLAVLGLGHVGTTALGFVDFGYDVIGTDENVSKLEMIRGGKPPFYEPGLDALLARAHTTGRLSITESAEEAVRGGTVLFVCVGTPQKGNGEPISVRWRPLLIRLLEIRTATS